MRASFQFLWFMPTESIDPRFVDLDAWPLGQAMEAMWEGQLAAVSAVHAALPAITRAVTEAAPLLARGGRLIYVGAGTSGRIAAQDGAELTPTFGWPAERTLVLLAGGKDALLASVEGAEDDAADGAARADAAALTAEDVVIGIAASGHTPFTVAAIEKAAAQGALTVGIANNGSSPLLKACRHPILLATGSELIAGSTRMKAGTGQKVVLNLISSGLMLRLGRVYRGMMVNMHVANAKLQRRARKIIMRIAGCSEREADNALGLAGNQLNLAIVVALGHDIRDAQALLDRHGGNLRALIEAQSPAG